MRLITAILLFQYLLPFSALAQSRQGLNSRVATELLQAYREEQTGVADVASAAPSPEDAAKGKFIGDPITFNGDSTWVVEGVKVIGKLLPAVPPLLDGKTTSGKFIVVTYAVQNRSRKTEQILTSPSIQDNNGNTYSNVEMHGVYLKHLLYDSSIELEKLPPGIRKQFAAIYEVPEPNLILSFNTRELGPIAPKTTGVYLVTRGTRSNTSTSVAEMTSARRYEIQSTTAKDRFTEALLSWAKSRPESFNLIERTTQTLTGTLNLPTEDLIKEYAAARDKNLDDALSLESKISSPETSEAVKSVAKRRLAEIRKAMNLERNSLLVGLSRHRAMLNLIDHLEMHQRILERIDIIKRLATVSTRGLDASHANSDEDIAKALKDDEPWIRDLTAMRELGADEGELKSFIYGVFSKEEKNVRSILDSNIEDQINAFMKPASSSAKSATNALDASGDAEAPISAEYLHTQPVPIRQVRPLYPKDMHRAGIPGEVLVSFVIDSNGVVQKAVALKSSQKEFEPAAIQAVLQWRFTPGKIKGKAVSTRLAVPILFTLNED